MHSGKVAASNLRVIEMYDEITAAQHKEKQGKDILNLTPVQDHCKNFLQLLSFEPEVNHFFEDPT